MQKKTKNNNRGSLLCCSEAVVMQPKNQKLYSTTKDFAFWHFSFTLNFVLEKFLPWPTIFSNFLFNLNTQKENTLFEFM